jgi:predicted Zn-dependent protease
MGISFATHHTMLRFFYVFCIALAATACNQVDAIFGSDKKEEKVTYSFACLDSAVSGSNINKRLGKAGDIIRDLAAPESKITDEVQSEYGRMFHQQMQEQPEFKLSTDKKVQQKLDKVLNDLLEARENGSNINYKVHLLEDTTVNAYTFGG